MGMGWDRLSRIRSTNRYPPWIGSINSKEISKLKQGMIYRIKIRHTNSRGISYISCIFKFNKISRFGGSEKYINYSWCHFTESHVIFPSVSYPRPMRQIPTKEFSFDNTKWMYKIALRNYKITPLTPSRAALVEKLVDDHKVRLL